MSYSEGLELTLNTRNPWMPVKAFQGFFNVTYIGILKNRFQA